MALLKQTGSAFPKGLLILAHSLVGLHVYSGLKELCCIPISKIQRVTKPKYYPEQLRPQKVFIFLHTLFPINSSAAFVCLRLAEPRAELGSRLNYLTSM